MSFSNLPEILFCDYDASAVEQKVITAYEAIAETHLYPGDPVRLFLESLAYIVAQQRFVIDWSAKQNLLAFAAGEYLDHLGALTDTPRMRARAARTTMRFSLTAPLEFAVPIPAGTRCTPDGELVFATDAAVEIPAGAVSVDAAATCSQPGATGNGFVSGQINKLMTPLAYVSATQNVTLSLGGTDIETDASLRQRIQLAPEKYTSAGSTGAYFYHALSAHQDIVDVAVYSPSPGVVDVRPLMAGGELPGDEILALVAAVLDADRVIPLCDTCRVLSPEPVAYALDITYYVLRSDAARIADIQGKVIAAVDEFALWQKSKMGRDITPSKLVALVHAAGAKRVEVASPAAWSKLEAWQVARESSTRVIYGGFEDA